MQEQEVARVNTEMSSRSSGGIWTGQKKWRARGPLIENIHFLSKVVIGNGLSLIVDPTGSKAFRHVPWDDVEWDRSFANPCTEVVPPANSAMGTAWYA